MTKLSDTYEVPLWIDGEMARGFNSLEPLFHAVKVSNISYEKFVGLSLLMQRAINKIQQEPNLKSFWTDITQKNTPLTTISWAGPNKEKISQSIFDKKNEKFKISLEPKKIISLFKKNPELIKQQQIQEDIMCYLLGYELACTRQMQKMHTSDDSILTRNLTLGEEIVQKSDATAVGLMVAKKCKVYPHAFDFLQKHVLPNLPNLQNILNYKTNVGKDLTIASLLMYEKEYRNQGKVWFSYPKQIIMATQYPDAFQDSALRLIRTLSQRTR